MHCDANSLNGRTDAPSVRAARLPFLTTLSPILGPIADLLLVVLLLIVPGGSGIGA